MAQALLSVPYTAASASIREVPDLTQNRPMSILVHVSSSLRTYSGCGPDIRVSGQTIAELLVHLRQEQPELYASVCDETGAVRQHINLFVNSEWIPARQEQGLARPLQPTDVLTIWPAVSGG